MINFSEFRKVLEEALVESEVLTHLYHNEELVINDGRKGFNNAIGNLYAVHNALTGGRKSSRVRITEKLDGCLAGDTLVVCKDGVKPISEITHEDEVKCYDVDTGETDYYNGMYIPPGHNDKRWVELTLEDGSTIKCTEDHLFLSGSEFIEAKDLFGFDIST